MATSRGDPRAASEAPSSTRSYDASGRQRDARRRRRRIVERATELFLERGYGATSIDEIAGGAGVAAPTIYATFGSKAGILKRAVDVAVGGDDDDVAVMDREPFQLVTSDAPLTERLPLAARLSYQSHERSAPLLRVVTSVAGADPAVAELEADLRRQFRETTAWFVASLPRGALRDDLTDDEIVDIVAWVSAPDTWSRLVTDAGWTRERYEAWYCDTLRRLVLRAPAD